MYLMIGFSFSVFAGWALLFYICAATLLSMLVLSGITVGTG